MERRAEQKDELCRTQKKKKSPTPFPPQLMAKRKQCVCSYFTPHALPLHFSIILICCSADLDKVTNTPTTGHTCKIQSVISRWELHHPDFTWQSRRSPDEQPFRAVCVVSQRMGTPLRDCTTCAHVCALFLFTGRLAQNNL